MTFNVKDFPAARLAPHGIAAVHPDAFVLACVDTAPAAVVEVVRRQAAGLRNPPMSARELVERLANQGLGRSAAALREIA